MQTTQAYLLSTCVDDDDMGSKLFDSSLPLSEKSERCQHESDSPRDLLFESEAFSHEYVVINVSHNCKEMVFEMNYT